MTSISELNCFFNSLNCRGWHEMILPVHTAFDHGVQDGQQLTHAGNQRHLFCLTRFDQPDIKGPDSRVKLNDGYYRHVKRAPHAGPSAKNRSSSPHFS